MRTHLLRQRQRVDRPLRRGHVARLQQARAHHGVGGRFQFALRDLVPQQRQLGLRGLATGPRRQRCLPCAGLPRPGAALRVVRPLRLGHLRGAAGAVHVLGADAAPLRVGGDAAQPRQVLLGTRRVGLRGDEPAARLGDFLGTRAVAQAQQRLLLRVHLRPRLIGLQRQRARVQHGQHGAGPHAVALFGAQFLHAAIAVEGQRDLADVHVAVVDEIAAAVALAVAPAAPGGSDRPRRRR